MKDERVEWVHLIVTVLKTKNNYRLRRLPPKNLEPNEICYAFQVTIDKNEWFGRIGEYQLPKVSPPEAKLKTMLQTITQPTSQLVLDRLAGRESTKHVEKKITFHLASIGDRLTYNRCSGYYGDSES